MNEIRFCLLGSLMVYRDGAAVMVPRGKQRVILAMLLLNSGRVVRVEELAEELWESGPPPSGPVAVQNYVMRLRKTLGDAGRDRIISQPGGYLIRVEADELDVWRFEALLGVARSAALDGAWDQAAAHAREALELWRGEPLADVDCEMLRTREAHRLAELHLQALEARIDADLHLGRHTGVIAELWQLAGTYPLREHLHGLLMTALYRDGRQAEALASYQQGRRILIEELGTEPGPALHNLHQQILTGDPALSSPQDPGPAVSAGPGSGTAAASAVDVRFSLPPDSAAFTGREAELGRITATVPDGAHAGGVVAIHAIGGMPGVGKTCSTPEIRPMDVSRDDGWPCWFV